MSISRFRKDDFDALRERLAVEATDELIDFWNNHISISPSDFVEIIYRDLPGDVCVQIQLDTSFNLKMEITGYSDSGTIFSAYRTLSFSNSEAIHELFEVEQSARNQGIGVAFTRNLFDLYVKLGLKKVKLVAGRENGGYFWAAIGFRTDAESWQNLQKECARRLAEIRVVLDARAFDAFTDVLTMSDPKALSFLIALGAEHRTLDSNENVAKVLLSGTGWYGEFDLDSGSASMIRFERYQRRIASSS
jgi:hypothetical protein